MSVTLLADGGSTKIAWAVVDGSAVRRFTTVGCNPYLAGPAAFREVLAAAVVPHVPAAVDAIYYYGAGCVDAVLPSLCACFSELFPAARVSCASDLVGACVATTAGKEGLVALLGTGANSCHYDGTTIVRHLPALGYILGDEGSGAAIGRAFLAALLRGKLSATIVAAWRERYALSLSEVLDKVYHSDSANTFLASFAPFVAEYSADASLHPLLVAVFQQFVDNAIVPYCRRDLPVHCVGSVAHHFAPFVDAALVAADYRLGTVLCSPLDGMLENFLSLRGI